MVIGHEDCGAVISTMKGGEVPGSIGIIINNIKPAIANYLGQEGDKVAIKQATEANVLYQINQLNQSPYNFIIETTFHLWLQHRKKRQILDGD